MEENREKRKKKKEQEHEIRQRQSNSVLGPILLGHLSSFPRSQ